LKQIKLTNNVSAIDSKSLIIGLIGGLLKKDVTAEIQACIPDETKV